MFDITKQFPTSMKIEGNEYRLNLDFKNVLNVFEIFKNDDLMNFEKLQFAFALLVKRNNKFNALALDSIFKDFLSITKQSKKTAVRSFDFKQDSIYIYSSFMMDYGIDLVENSMHWWKFIALFNGLSDRTKIKEVISIRQRPIPELNKNNAEVIQSLMELKNYYALEITQEEREQNFLSGLATLFNNVKARAVHK